MAIYAWCMVVRGWRALVSTAVAVGLSLAAIGELNAQDRHPCIISDQGIGPVKIGMTLREAKGALPAAVFRRTSDGDGAALVTIGTRTADWMTVYAQEGEVAAPIKWSQTIRFIETFHPACRTVSGVHPGMLVRDAEKRLGKVREIVQSEIESRQYVSFSRQPRLLFRIDDAGVFGPDARRTTQYAAGATLLSIAVVPE